MSDERFPRALSLMPQSIGSRSVHLRMPSIDRGVQAFIWALVFFLYMWFGALLLDYPGGTSLVISLVLAAGIFLLVRTRGGDHR
jgi:hypothetical protein